MKRSAFAVLLLLLAGTAARSSAAAPEPAWKFAVISDIHLTAKGEGPFLKKLITRLIAERPDFVVINGDFTRGTPDDNIPLETVRAWWKRIEAALQPLRDAGIPVVPVPGNHDFYTAAHQQAYKEAWEFFAPGLSSFTVRGTPPLNYSFDHKSVHFAAINAVNSYLPEEEAAWLKNDLKQAEKAELRFVFGHIPFDSALGKPVASFKKALGGVLAGGNVAAYICGHEHLNWDQTQLIGGRPLRQVIVGSAIDEQPYYYPVRRALSAAWCRPCDGTCMMPYDKRHFATDPKTRLQKVSQTFYMFEINPQLKNGYSATPYTLDKAGRLAPFYMPGDGGPLAPCQAVRR